MADNDTSELPTPRIEVFEYLGYNGGFARERIPLFKCVVIGANGTRRPSNPNTWHGYSDPQYAQRDAQEWSEFTDWPVFDLGRRSDRDDPVKTR